ncbi:TolC family protein [Mediterranea massiliensis]|uniref:TolC family protein n=1 Tax=Mediterranea massiliensis TaxID=1841865 RepID=UPI00266C987B|nr:TolC family protein [Mediterranea massiliensis]
MDELFSLADKNSKSIRLHQLVIREAEQGIKVARNAYLPSLSVKAEATYIGDGCMTDRDFSNGVHADMPHWGNSFVVKAQQTLYAGGSIQSSVRQSKLQKQAAEQTHLDNRQDLRFLLAGYYTWTCSN